jgi:hypothetical protein
LGFCAEGGSRSHDQGLMSRLAINFSNLAIVPKDRYYQKQKIFLKNHYFLECCATAFYPTNNLIVALWIGSTHLPLALEIGPIEN